MLLTASSLILVVSLAFSAPSVPSLTVRVLQRSIEFTVNATSGVTQLHVQLLSTSGHILNVTSCDSSVCNGSFTGLTPYQQYTVMTWSQFHDKTSFTVNETRVTKEDVPSPPLSVTVDSFTSSSLSLSWQTPQHPNGLILSYSVTCHIVDFVTHKLVSPSVTDTVTNVTSITIVDLQAGETFRCNVTGRTSAGTGSSSDSVLQLLDDAAAESVTFTSHDVTALSVQVMWSALNKSSGVIFEYLVTVQEKSSNSCVSAVTLSCTDCSRSRDNLTQEQKTDLVNRESACTHRDQKDFTFGENPLTARTGDHLKPFTDYTVTVIPVNRVGLGVSQSITVKTNESRSSQVESLKLKTVTHDSMSVTFEKPVNENGMIVSFFVKVINQSVTSQCVLVNLTDSSCSNCDSIRLIDSLNSSCSQPYRVVNAESSQTEFTVKVTQLKPWTNYTVVVTPVSQFFTGNEAEVTEETLEFNPQPVRSLSVTLTDTKAELRWQRPAEPNGLLTGFVYFVRNATPAAESVTENLSEWMSVKVTGLQQCTFYAFSVLAFNRGFNSSLETVTGHSDIGSPGQTSGASVTVESRSVTVNWPAITHGNCRVLYKIYKNGTSVKTNWTENLYTFTDLEPYTVYNFMVNTWIEYQTDVKETKYFEITNRTLHSRASPPLNFKCVNVTDDVNSVSCTWQLPEDIHGILSHFVVTLSNQTDEVTRWNVGNVTHKVLKDSNLIRPDLTLKFRIFAFNSFVNGEESEVSEVSITPLAPFPQNVTVEQLQNLVSLSTPSVNGHHQLVLHLPFSSLFTNQFGEVQERLLLIGANNDANRDRLEAADVLSPSVNSRFRWTWQDSNRGVDRPYYLDVTSNTAPSSSRSLKAISDDETEFVVGSDADCSGDCNGPLWDDVEYSIGFMACTSQKCETTRLLMAKTQPDVGRRVGISFGILVPLMLLLVAATALVCFKRGQLANLPPFRSL
jgi:hypothetical protein